MSAASFFIDMRRLHLDLRMQLLQSSSISDQCVLQQCRAAAIIFKSILPRGIQLFQLGNPELSWYISVTGEVRREKILLGIEFGRMRTGMASLLCDGQIFTAIFSPLTVQCAEVRRGVSGWIHVLRPLNGCSVWVPENYWVVTARN